VDLLKSGQLEQRVGNHTLTEFDLEGVVAKTLGGREFRLRRRAERGPSRRTALEGRLGRVGAPRFVGDTA
jgi:hypothetical protein